MNRRTLLKSAGIGAAFMFSARAGVHLSRAQVPAYDAELIYEFTTFIDDDYTQLIDGFASSASSDGTIVGSSVVDGRTVPVRWDLAGNLTLLETGDIPFGSSWNMFINADGEIAGNLGEGTGFDSRIFGVTWTDGTPATLEVLDPAVSQSVYSLNDGGVIVGNADGVASRWIDGTLEQLPLPDGATSSTVVAVSPKGVCYGREINSEGLFGLPWRWHLDGSLEELPLPDDVLARPTAKVTSIRYPAVFDDGVYVTSLSIKEGDAYWDGAYAFDGATFTLLPGSGQETYSTAYFAPSMSEIYGSILGAGVNTGATVWIDNIPTLLRNQVALPAGVGLGSIVGKTAAGELIARTSVTGETPTPGILVLRPA